MAATPFVLTLLVTTLTFTATSAVESDNKDPGEQCDIFYTKCQGGSRCLLTDDKSPYYGTCLCEDGYVLHDGRCTNCSMDGEPSCGENAECAGPDSDGKHRCKCIGDTVTDILNNDGRCKKCDPQLAGKIAEGCGALGACIYSGNSTVDDENPETECRCLNGYIKDEYTKSCRECGFEKYDNGTVGYDECASLGTNSECLLSLKSNRYKCSCEFGEYTWNHDGSECVRCNSKDAKGNSAVCENGMECLKPKDLDHTKCYETCNLDDCRPGSTSRVCSHTQEDIGTYKVCRCKEKYKREMDGTCVPTLNKLTCYTCEHSDSKCSYEQTKDLNYYKLCDDGEVCYTQLSRKSHEQGKYGHITYKRNCRPYVCNKFTVTGLCTFNKDLMEQQCLYCCEDQLCNSFLVDLDDGVVHRLSGVLLLATVVMATTFM